MRSRKGSHLHEGVNRTGDPILTYMVFHAMNIILSLKLGDHEGFTVFVHGQLLKRTLHIVLPAILIQIPTCAFLSRVPDVQRETSQLMENYKAGMFIAAPGATGIAPPNLHTKSQSMHIFITKFI